MKYFGTDGIRGTVNKSLTYKTAFNCGNAVASLKFKAKIVVGVDTRTSASMLLSAFSSGAVMAGADVYFVGVVPTPVISFLVQHKHFDFGVMITASHNPPKDNGIKVFDNNGEKVNTETKEKIEKRFCHKKIVDVLDFGKIRYMPRMLNDYIKFVTQNCHSLQGLKVVLDVCHGASTTTASKIFKKLGANVIELNHSANGKLINDNCGALHPQQVVEAVKKHKGDVGFAFDGDADRVVVVDETGQIRDGDQILYFFANMYKKFGLLQKNTIVSTILSNINLEKEVKKAGIDFVRTDVGDHFVEAELAKSGLQLGGEPAGHIILHDFEKTGDGVFCASQICKFLKMLNQPLSHYTNLQLVKQFSLNLSTDKKDQIAKDNNFLKLVYDQKTILNNKGRLIVRPSGTENLIRIMVECDDEFLAHSILEQIKNFVENYNK